ncbi:MAG: hypothetical protein JOS17DRAFT_777960 [Linnemannia elongata]|nr:MAG: hypothetical protein JOS17DRAFT_777960 [Linnemannia elongata]
MSFFQQFRLGNDIESLALRRDTHGTPYSQMTDITDIFPGALRFKVNGVNILFLENEHGQRYEPTRIAYYPDAITDVVTVASVLSPPPYMTADSDVAGSSALSLLSYVSVTSQVNTAQVVSNSAMPLQGQTVSKSSEKQMSPDYAQSKSREIKTSDKQDEHSNRSLEAQYRTDASFLQHYEPPEWNIPRMLIVLPESIEKCDPYKLSVDDFQLYFLCERDHHGNTNAVKSNSFSSSGRLIVATAASTTPYTANTQDHRMSMAIAVDGADLRRLKTFLSEEDADKACSKIYKIITESSQVNWVCFCNYRQLNREAALSSFLQSAVNNGSAYDVQLGKFSVSLKSSAAAQDFFSRLRTQAPTITALKVTLDWSFNPTDLVLMVDKTVFVYPGGTHAVLSSIKSGNSGPCSSLQLTFTLGASWYSNPCKVDAFGALCEMTPGSLALMTSLLQGLPLVHFGMNDLTSRLLDKSVSKNILIEVLQWLNFSQLKVLTVNGDDYNWDAEAVLARRSAEFADGFELQLSWDDRRNICDFHREDSRSAEGSSRRLARLHVRAARFAVFDSEYCSSISPSH